MSKLELFIDGRMVKKGDKLVYYAINRDPLYIVFDRVDSDGYIRPSGDRSYDAYVSYGWEFDRRDKCPKLSVEERLQKLEEEVLKFNNLM